MKKVISFLLVLTLACSIAPVGYGTQAPEEPKMETAIIQADGVPAIRCFLKQGDRVVVTEELDEKISLVETEQGDGMLETQLLRFPWETEYESWVGYVRSSTAFFKDYELCGKPLKTLTLNTKVLVLDELEESFLISLDLELPEEEPDQQEPEKEIRIGYVEKSKISKTRIEESYSGDSGYSPPPVSPGSSHQDGGDISMAYYGLSLLSNAPTEPEKIGEAQVRVDDAKLILLYFMKGDTVQLVAEEEFAPEYEGYRTIYLDGTYAYIPEGWILMEGEEPFKSWDGYAGSGCRLFDNYLLRGKAVQTLPMNTKLTVLWDNGTVSVVRLEDKNETIGFVDSAALRTSPVPTGGGDYSGSGSSGNNGNFGSTGEWTPPAL